MAAQLLGQYGSLTAVLAEPAQELARTTGNTALATILSSAKSMVVESLLADLPKATYAPTNQDFLRFITSIMSGLTHEEAHVLFLDGRLRFLRHEPFCYGDVAEVHFPVPTILRRALHVGASQLVLVHNHPSGSPEPSDIDKQATARIAAAAGAIGITVHDHLVVAGPHVFSFRAAGML